MAKVIKGDLEVHMFDLLGYFGQEEARKLYMYLSNVQHTKSSSEGIKMKLIKLTVRRSLKPVASISALRVP